MYEKWYQDEINYTVIPTYLSITVLNHLDSSYKGVRGFTMKYT